MPSACPTLARALLFAPAVCWQAHSRLPSLTLADGAPWAPRKPRGLQCHIKRGREHSFQSPLFCHPQTCKMEQFTPSSAGCSLQCSHGLRRGREGLRQRLPVPARRVPRVGLFRSVALPLLKGTGLWMEGWTSGTFRRKNKKQEKQ